MIIDPRKAKGGNIPLLAPPSDKYIIQMSRDTRLPTNFQEFYIFSLLNIHSKF